MLKKICFFISLAISLPYIAYSQQKDFNTWITLELKGQLFKLINFNIVPELRLWDNSTRIQSALGEIEVSVPVAKHFELGVVYRMKWDVSQPDYYKKEQRFGIFGAASYKIKRLKIGYKASYFQDYTNINTSELGHVPVNQHRHRLTLKYNIKKSPISPYAMAEMYFTLNPEWKEHERKLRSAVGIDYKINKNINVTVCYKYQRQYNTNNPKTDHILAVGMEYNL